MSRRSRRIVTALLLAAVAAFAAFASSRAEGQRRLAQASSRLGTCGVERWAVKTLQDQPHLLPARPTTVARLARLRRPTYIADVRLPLERHVFAVTAAVTQIRSEDDEDLHLVLTSGANQMIAEAPDASSCAPRATAARRQQMVRARSLGRVCAKARVVGVAFWDFKHGQTGVAPNGIELHPILGFTCLSG
jgi:hypothetical protein